MGKTRPDQTPAKVIRWLRTPAGEYWSRCRIGWTGRIARHAEESGAFADVIPDSAGRYARARWPDPYKDSDLDNAQD